jgi:hypothetical protein
MYALTVFKSPRWWEEQQRFVYDNKTHRRIDIDTWDQLVKFFYKMSERKLNGKQDAELISPAVFEDGAPRRNANVLAWAGWAAVDVDDWHFEGDLESELRNRFGHWSYICYSTASSSEAQPKFRLVFRLDVSVPQAQIKHFWSALNSELDGMGDKQTKDLCRMYYIPAQYADANNFIFSNNGACIVVSDLCRKWPYSEKLGGTSFLDRLPDAFREQVIEHRKSALDNTSFVWAGYHDCPFWPKKLATEYMTISSGGWYRQMYRIMIAVAGNAIKNQYPITAHQIVELCKQFDVDTGNWYENRPLEVEANNALEYAYKNG